MLSSRYDHQRKDFMFTRQRQCYEPPPQATKPIKAWGKYAAQVFFFGAFLAGLCAGPQILTWVLS